MGKEFTTSFSLGVNDASGMKYDWFDFVLSISQYMNLKLLRFYAIGGLADFGSDHNNELEMFNTFWRMRLHQYVHEGDIVSISYLGFSAQGDPTSWLRMYMDVYEYNTNISYVRITERNDYPDYYYITPYDSNDNAISVTHRRVTLYAQSGDVSASASSASTIRCPKSNGAMADVSYRGAGPFYDKWHDEWLDTSIGKCWNTYFFLKSRQTSYDPSGHTPIPDEQYLPGPEPVPEEPEGEVTPG